MNYNCWYCNKDCKQEKRRFFSFEFDAPICETCLNKLFAKPMIALNREEAIIRNEFEVIWNPVKTSESYHD